MLAELRFEAPYTLARSRREAPPQTPDGASL